MYPTPLSFLGPLGGKRILICGIGVESVAFTLAGADVYGFGSSVSQVEAVKDLARGLALRDRIHLQTGTMNELAYPDRFFDLAFGKTVPENADLESGVRELGRVLKPGARAAFVLRTDGPLQETARRVFGSAVLGECWIGVEKSWEENRESHRSDSNRRPHPSDTPVTNRPPHYQPRTTRI
ncbi:MAG TPA: methyltransferase domain-containing protein [Gemmatimonadales bacterium]